MAAPLVLRVLTPQRELCDEPVEQLTAEGTPGQFGVLPDHTVFLTSLEPGALSFRPADGGQRTLAVKGGYAEVRDNVVTVLADDALPVESIDPSQARADLERASAALDAAPFGDREHERARRELRWAEVRLALAGG
ncbi:MAG: ATP synthase F1 subunit epsilon [Deltaproteobacteria bacterium]|nr:ATP synthase F1 subunit epsilon [Deltaproteobacteria bacterium]